MELWMNTRLDHYPQELEGVTNDIFMSMTQGSWRKNKANDDDKLEAPAKLGKQET